MTRRLLHLIATPRGLASNTGRISSVLLEALHDRYDDLEVQALDLFSADLPAVAGTNIKSKYALMTGQALDDEARSSWREIERTIETFLAADLYLVTAPMWNFGVPYALKYYIDAIIQPGYLFEYDEDGQPRGMVHDRRMVCVTSRGGDYSQGPMMQFDFLESYLRAIFGFVGIADITFFNVQPMDVTSELRRSASRAAIRDVRSWVAQGAWDGSPTEVSDLLPADVKPQVIVE
ncbi:FMN-dependent NADH-azoreductase [Nocardioides antri]|uniref:FMN-dependent NADH-azoreductase n=1 Tax=Nocardioides antri TaxID=2607659 RepID=UPI00165F63BA|nr:NAD(P)H-dependent oxidoreductase [Nocardioides antri]